MAHATSDALLLRMMVFLISGMIQKVIEGEMDLVKAYSENSQ